MKICSISNLSLCLSLLLLSGAGAESNPPSASPTPAVEEVSFRSTPPINLAGKQDFPDLQQLSDDAASQLNTLCSLKEFQALPARDRHVYSFDPWPNSKDDLEQKSYCFNFYLGLEEAGSLKVVFKPTGGGPGKPQTLNRIKEPEGSQYILQGFGNLSWGGRSEHTFRLDKPVKAFGVVLKSSGDVDLRRFFWPAAKELNGYPVSYTLADGTVIQLGQRELSGAVIKGNTNTFLGVIDRTGCGIVSVTYTIKGLGGNVAQSICMRDLVFATLPKPVVAPIINLKGSCDFYAPETISASPEPAEPGLASLEDFREIVGNHRFVYRFDPWPQKNPAFESDTGEFSFDLNGKGAIGQKVRITATGTAGNSHLSQAVLKDREAMDYHALGGLGEIGKGKWAEQTLKFEKPVWGLGITYRSPADVHLVKFDYTLSDGTIVHPEVSGRKISADQKTFVGAIDDTDKGITSVSLRVQGTASGAQPLFIEDLAFALSGPPPGDWKMTLDENFNGDALDPNVWTPGYTFPDVINAEKQGYVPENVVVRNGICTIKVEQRDCVNTDRYGRQKGPPQKFASGAFTSFDKFTQTYGYFEARIRMPKPRGAGIWPAFWSLPDRGREYVDERLRRTNRTDQYGRGAEIDIFEFMPWWKKPNGRFPIHMGCIWSYGKVTEQDPAPHGYGSYAMKNDGWGPEEYEIAALDTRFHTYGVYWSPERLIFYVDSKPVFRVKDPQHVPDVPQYFLFNVAISGNGWGKGPDKKNPTLQEMIEDLPNQMEIDYFRAYSGRLEEAVPASPTDDPSVIRKYSPPPKEATAQPPAAPSAPAPAASPATGVPPAPANAEISSPSNG